MNVIILSPPFYSHFRPLLALAAALKRGGADPCIACTTAFEPEIRAAGMRFRELRINRNANTGRAAATVQEHAERQRLEEFLQATRNGPIETLRTQNRHRPADMLANPEELLQRVATLAAQERPDLWVVDQLSYGATLALIAHGLRFVTFCPPHPLSIPPADRLYSVPRRFPSPFTVSKDALATLESEAGELDRQFTQRFFLAARRAAGYGPPQSGPKIIKPHNETAADHQSVDEAIGRSDVESSGTHRRETKPDAPEHGSSA